MKITYVMGTDIRTGRGSENVLINYIKYSTIKKSDISIVQNHSSSPHRLSTEEVNKVINGSKIYTFPTYFKLTKIATLLKDGSVLRMAFNIALVKLNLIILSIKFKKTINYICKNSDIIYFIANEYIPLFKNSKAIKIGSNHCINPKAIFDKTYRHHYLHVLNEKRYYKLMDGFHFFPSNSKYVKRLYKPYNFVLSNGVDTNVFKPRYNKNRKIIKFFFVAALTIPKGIKTLTDSWQLIKNKEEIELHIAGTGTMTSYIKNLAKNRENKIFYHGVLPTKKLATLYRNCDVFVYPSKADTFSLTVLEALSSGLYVLASDFLVGTFDDFKSRGYLEYINRNPLIISKRMSEIAVSKKELKRNIKKQYEYVKNNYDWKIITKKLYDEFRKMDISSKKIE
jgi:glycosyltransferase involved in cell wall biosynthesis